MIGLQKILLYFFKRIHGGFNIYLIFIIVNSHSSMAKTERKNANLSGIIKRKIYSWAVAAAVVDDDDIFWRVDVFLSNFAC